MKKNTSNFGFTLAEVLVTLAVLGIVAVLTIPTILIRYKEKVFENQNWSVVYKLTLATDQMKANGLIGNYASTKDFVNELKNNYKISKICDNSHLEDCWPTKTITRIDGTEVNVADLKTGKNFGNEGYTGANVGLITNDGTPIIMSFKDECKTLDAFTGYGWTLLGGKPFTNATTSCIAMIYDLNGKGGPNKSGEDVRLFNVASLNKGLECTDAYGVCMMATNVSYEPLTFSECEQYKSELGISVCDSSGHKDYWSGAKKACHDLGGRLMTEAEAQSLLSGMGSNCGTRSDHQYCYNIKEDRHNLQNAGDRTIYWIDYQDEIDGLLYSKTLSFGTFSIGNNVTAMSIGTDYRHNAGGHDEWYFARCVAD